MGNRCTHYTAADKPCPICNPPQFITVLQDKTEQRRYEIAKDVMAVSSNQIESRAGNDFLRICAEDAVRAADALLAALAESKEG